MAITRWQPFAELVSLRQAMDRLFEDSFVSPTRLLTALAPDVGVPVDVYGTENEVVVRAALPGVKPEEVDISITGDTLTIKGETKAEEETKRENYLYRERRYGAFYRMVTLPSGLNTDQAEATFDNGVLTLTIPKSERVKPKVIKVKAKGVIEGKK